MQTLWRTFLKGLAAALPLGLTLYFIYWLATAIESLLRPVITLVLPEQQYVPGLGVVVGLVLLFFAGLAVNAWIIQRLIEIGGRILESIPLVKSIYTAMRDFMDYFSGGSGDTDMKQVVIVSIGGANALGFLTCADMQRLPKLAQAIAERDDTAPASQSEELVGVYLPMSYQIGGYTLYLPRSQVTPVDMSMEDAMRHVLTAGLARGTAPASMPKNAD